MDEYGGHGGIEAYGRQLIDGIAARGHTVEIVEAAPDVVYRNLRLEDYWPSAAFSRRYYYWRRTPSEDYRYHRALQRHAKAITRSFQPDVVHSLHLHWYGGILGADAPGIVTA